MNNSLLSMTPSDLEELFRQAPAFFAVVRGPDHVFERVNDAYMRIVGHRDILGKPVLEALPEIRGQGFEKLLDSVLRTGEPFIVNGIEVTLERAPGAPLEKVFVDLVYQPLRDADGTPIGVIMYGSDVTEQVTARQEAQENARELEEQIEETQAVTAELEESNEQLQELNVELEEERDRAEASGRRVAEVLESLSDSVSVFDRDWRWSYLNTAAANVLTAMGKDVSQMVGKILWEELPALVGTRFESETRRAEREGVNVEYEEYLAPLDRWFEIRVVPSSNGVTTFSRDVTGRHRTDNELRSSEEQFRTALNMIPALAWIANEDGWIFWYNERWYDYTGTTERDMEGWGWQAVHDPEILPSVMERWTASISSGESFEMEFPLRSATGEFRWFLTRVAPLRDGQGQIRRWFGTNTDVHIQREAAEAARDANQAKSDFLAAMSHETRQPINATLGFVDILEMGMYGPLPEKQREAISRIRVNQEQLLSVVTDILSFARLEAGRVEVQRETVNCSELLSALPALVDPQVTVRELELVVEKCAPDLFVTGDRNRILQVCTNLITNAARATDRGGKISLRCIARDDKVDLEVTDTGAGIPADKFEKIFAPFVQLERKLNSPREGVGLGLAISRDLTHGMGGEISVRSEVGLGSTFTVTLPRAHSPLP